MASTVAGEKEAFPVWQLSILLAVRLVEPLAINSVVPYLLAMVRFTAPELGDVEATKIVTLLFSTYALAQFSTNIAWGRLSDRIGRRPTMLFGLIGIFSATLGFALCDSIAGMFACRLAAGLLSGNVVITRAIIGDMVHDRENKARAFAWNQTAFQVGQVVGPIVGGYLVQPCSQLPGLCRNGRFAWLAAHPFALPNLLLAGLVAVSFLTAYFFLNETLVHKPHLCDVSKSATEESPLLMSDDDAATIISSSSSTKSSPPRTLLTSQVCHVIASYACMALHTFCFDQVFPVFLATGPDTSSHLPWALRGGLGYTAPAVANLVAASGLLSIVFMLGLYAPVDNHFGTLRCMRSSLLLYPAIYILLPYLVLLPGSSPRWPQLAGVTVITATKILAAVFSFNDNAVLLTVAAPSPRGLGFVNGVAQMAAAGARAVGPALMGVILGWSHQFGTDALGWWFLAVTAIAGVVQGFWVTDEEEEEELREQLEQRYERNR